MARRPPLPTTSEAGGFAEGMRWLPVRATHALPPGGVPACGVVSGSSTSFNPLDGTTTSGVVAPGYEDDAALVLDAAGLQAGRTGLATDANDVIAAYVAGPGDGFYGTRFDYAVTDPDRYKLHPVGPTTDGRTTRPGGFRLVPGSAFQIGGVWVARFVRGANPASQQRSGFVTAVPGYVNSASYLGGQALGLGTKVVTDGVLGVYHQAPAVRVYTLSEDVYNHYWLTGLAGGYGFPAWLEQVGLSVWAGCVVDSPALGAVTVSLCNGGFLAATLSYNYLPAVYTGTPDPRAFVLSGFLPGANYSSRYAVTRNGDGFCYGGDANNAGGHRFRGGLWISYTAPPSPPAVPPVVSPPFVSPAPTPGLPPPVTGTPTGTDAAIITDLITAVNDLLAWAGTITTEQNEQNGELAFLHGWVADVTAATHAADGYALAVTAGVTFAAAGSVT